MLAVGSFESYASLCDLLTVVLLRRCLISDLKCDGPAGPFDLAGKVPVCYIFSNCLRGTRRRLCQRCRSMIPRRTSLSRRRRATRLLSREHWVRVQWYWYFTVSISGRSEGMSCLSFETHMIVFVR